MRPGSAAAWAEAAFSLTIIAGAPGSSCADEPPVADQVRQPVAAPRPADVLVADFTGSDWGRVLRAAERLERQPARAVPRLVRLLARDDFIKLRNTADLIYPGAETFYGHGWIVPYDLDRLSVRAGWKLEQIAFQDFGFSERGIEEDDLLDAAIAGRRDVPLGEVTEVDADAARRGRRRSRAVARAQAWWHANGPGWTRLAALTAALRAENPRRIGQALRWLRFDRSPIPGFTRDRYVRNIYPIVRQLAESQDDGVASQAAELVEDYEKGHWYWLEQKAD